MSKATGPEKAWRAFKRVQSTMMPLLELFSVCDDVFTEENAFAPENINKTAGRIYREWLKCRKALDPEFDPKNYPKTPRRKNQPAKEQRIFSTGTTWISEKSPKKKESLGKKSVRTSVRGA